MAIASLYASGLDGRARNEGVNTMRIIEEFDDYLEPEDQERLLDPIDEEDE